MHHCKQYRKEAFSMTTLSRLINENGGMRALRKGGILRVVNRSGSSLEIEYGLPEEKGDIVTVSQRDPQENLVVVMQFKVEQFEWEPRSSLDPRTLKESQVFTRCGSNRQLLVINFQLHRRLVKFARQWDETLKQQGFIEADEQSKYYPLFSDELLLAAGMETY